MSQALPPFDGEVRNRKLNLDNRDQFYGYFAGLEGKRVQVTVERYYKKRSLPQDSYYFGVVVATIAEETRQDPDTVHETLKAELLKKSVLFRGRYIQFVQSATAQDTIALEIYLERIREHFAREFSIKIPLPNEVAVH